jgi:hypothetical protein
MQNLDLELRKQVAIATGKNVFKGDYCSMSIPIPEYELSIDAIAAEFKKRNWFYEVAWMPSLNLARADDVNAFEVRAETEAIALCKLFLALCKQEQEIK